MARALKLLLALCIVAGVIALAAALFGSLSTVSDGAPNASVDRSAKPPSYPESLIASEDDDGGTVVTAKALNAAPGAIVCSDNQEVGLVFHLYSNSWEEHAQDNLTHGQSKLLRGEAAPEPDPGSYGCALIPPGTEMRLHLGSVVPIVTVRMADGRTIKGVTWPAMMASQAETQASAATEDFRATIMGTRAEFQRQFSSLQGPAPNLRWFQSSGFSILVMPFGPCAVLQKAEGGYFVMEIDPLSTSGPFISRDEADQQAEVLCNNFYQGMLQDPNAKMGPNSPPERISWFPPESPPK